MVFHFVLGSKEVLRELCFELGSGRLGSGRREVAGMAAFHRRNFIEEISWGKRSKLISTINGSEATRIACESGFGSQSGYRYV